MVGTLDYRVLGHVDVRHRDLSVAPPGVRRRSLLALLVLGRGRPVPVSDLVEGLWGEEPPRSAENLVQTYISLWRRVLDGALDVEAGTSRVRTVGRGYQLVVGPDEVDLDRFEDLWHRATCCTEPRAKHALFAEAMAQWSGEPLADLSAEPFYRDASGVLLERRRRFLVQWTDVALDAGSPGDVVAPLRAALCREPLEELLTAALMQALAAEGRSSDALLTYEQFRCRLSEQLGADPGPALAEVHLHVLRQDGRLRAPASLLPVFPGPTDTFYGREDDVRRVRTLVAEQRLVTLVGPGGCGKTRLAVEAGRALVEDGWRVAFVDAVPLVSADQLSDRIASTLGVRAVPGQRVSDALAVAFTEAAPVLLLDNLEHLPGAGDTVLRLLSASSALRVLATSRDPLQLAGERLFHVRPLSTETGGSASQLFLDRAQAADDRLSGSDVDSELVAAVCRRLDGLPLAIELAAGWSVLFSPAELLRRLEHDTRLLVGPERMGGGRHDSLRAALSGTYELLGEDDRRVLHGLAVARGGASPEVIAEVTSLDDGAVLLALRSLAGRGLLEGTLDRHHLLQTVSEYALERLAASADAGAVRRRYVGHYALLAERSARELLTSAQPAALVTLDGERDNVTSALLALPEMGESERALVTAAGLWRWWHLRGHLEEGSRLLTTLLVTAGCVGDRPRAAVLLALGNLDYWQRDYASAGTRYAEATELARACDDRSAVIEGLLDSAYVAALTDQHEAASRLFDETCSAALVAGDDLAVALARAGLAYEYFSQGRYADAEGLLLLSLPEIRRSGDGFSVANSLALLAAALRCAGRVEEAMQVLPAALSGHLDLGHSAGVTWVLHECAAVLGERRPDQALTLLGAAEALDSTGDPGTCVPYELLRFPALSPETACGLSHADARAAWERGAALSLRGAVAFAMDSVRPVS